MSLQTRTIRNRIVPKSKPNRKPTDMHAGSPKRPLAESPPRYPGTEVPAELSVDSQTLFSGGRNELTIRHNGRLYRLRCTRLGKLILTA